MMTTRRPWKLRKRTLSNLLHKFIPGNGCPFYGRPLRFKKLLPHFLIEDHGLVGVGEDAVLEVPTDGA